MPPGPAPPRAPSTTTVEVASGANPSFPADTRAAAMPSAVRRDVPEGASRLASWWSSMISALSNHGAAMAANRIIRTAPMAKLAATMQLAPPTDPGTNSSARSSRSSSVNPVVPTTAWMPADAQWARVVLEISREVKSTTTSTSAAERVDTSATTVTPSEAGPDVPTRSATVDPAYPGSAAATSSSPGRFSTVRQTSRPIRPPAPTTPTHMPVPLAKAPVAPEASRSRAARTGGSRHATDRHAGRRALWRQVRRIRSSAQAERPDVEVRLVERPHHRKRAGRGDHGPGRLVHVIEGERLDPGQHLVDSQDLAVQEHAGADAAHPGAGVLAGQEGFGPQVALGLSLIHIS